MDVLEIDAATHTGIDNVREVIISGLSIRPVRNRYKIFIIDEVHQLSAASFNALLKSIEGPAAVAFIMATTALDKIPETILSRSWCTSSRRSPATRLPSSYEASSKPDGIDASPRGNAASWRATPRAACAMRRRSLRPGDCVCGQHGCRRGRRHGCRAPGRDLLLDTFRPSRTRTGRPPSSPGAGRSELGYDLRAVFRRTVLPRARSAGYCRLIPRRSPIRDCPLTRTASASRRFRRGFRARTSCAPFDR